MAKARYYRSMNALSRYRTFVLTAYSRLLLMVQMFPLILAIIPLFILFHNLGMVDSYLSVILNLCGRQPPVRYLDVQSVGVQEEAAPLRIFTCRELE